MKIQDLMKAWEQAVDEATIEQKRADEIEEMLVTCTGLRAGHYVATGQCASANCGGNNYSSNCGPNYTVTMGIGNGYPCGENTYSC